MYANRVLTVFVKRHFEQFREIKGDAKMKSDIYIQQIINPEETVLLVNSYSQLCLSLS